jgi:competence protein ComEC
VGVTPRLLAIGLVVIAVLAFLAWRETSLSGNGALRVVFVDVGQGDGAVLIAPGGEQIVVDGGPNQAMLGALGALMPFLDRQVELMILSHPHLDHVASFPDIVERYDVREILMSGVHAGLPAYQRFLSLLQNEGARVDLADPAKDIDLGALRFDVLWPQPGLVGQEADLNNTSVVVRASFGSSSVLFTGDIGEEAEREILSEGIDVRADILKVAHHGSRTSSTTAFLKAVNPRLAVISVAEQNRYGHPTQEALDRLAALGIPVRMTKDEGDICLQTTGKDDWGEC